MKTAVVTGAASGIGLATVAHLVEEGYFVHGLDIHEGLPEIMRKVDSKKTQAHVGDVSVQDLWMQVKKATGQKLDLMVHNAFTLHIAPLHEQSVSQWGRQWAVMLDPVLHSITQFHEQLKNAQGCVVLVSSVHARIGLPGHPAYAAAKGALSALARQLAAEYGPEVRVNSVLPGPIATPIWDSVSPEAVKTTARATALKRLGTADEVAAVIGFLGSSGASYIDGAEIVVDGGWSITKDSS
jgi:NAD(P)-dependent dehydrogenase (short-subunit alcohol dehydrogenase family)